jgi:putative flippase GtrA
MIEQPPLSVSSVAPRATFRERLAALLRPFLSRRFARFCSVGASGVIVNLGVMHLLRRCGVHVNLASGIAIELSMLSNFALNHAWTFGDKRVAGMGWLQRALRFHAVSLGGGAIQFMVFVAGNVLWLLTVLDHSARWAYLAGGHTFFERWFVRPFVSPPEVGVLAYVSQIAGIGAAMGWNYLANFHWTWAKSREDSHA